MYNLIYNAAVFFMQFYYFAKLCDSIPLNIVFAGISSKMIVCLPRLCVLALLMLHVTTTLAKPTAGKFTQQIISQIIMQ